MDRTEEQKLMPRLKNYTSTQRKSIIKIKKAMDHMWDMRSDMVQGRAIRELTNNYLLRAGMKAGVIEKVNKDGFYRYCSSVRPTLKTCEKLYEDCLVFQRASVEKKKAKRAEVIKKKKRPSNWTLGILKPKDKEASEKRVRRKKSPTRKLLKEKVILFGLYRVTEYIYD